MTRPALVLEHGPLGPPGLLAEWLAEEGIEMVLHRVDGGGPFPDPRGYSFVASLGSRFAPTDSGQPDVAAELRYLGRVVEADVPVLGLCFGGQMLASVLGGKVERAARPELGWHVIETDDPGTVPAGPWLQWHFDRFHTPPGATEIARTDVATQAFRMGPHLGVQFHPESTIEIVRGWARPDDERFTSLGLDVEEMLEGGRDHAAQAAVNARTLFDGFRNQVRTTQGA